MQKDQQKLAQLIQGKKVAFIGAGVSHKTLIKEFVELGAHVTLCDQKKSVEDFGDYAATIRELGIDLSLGENYLDGFKGQDIIMRTPGFVGYFEKPLQDAMAAGTMVTSEVELFFDFCCFRLQAPPARRRCSEWRKTPPHRARQSRHGKCAGTQIQNPRR